EADLQEGFWADPPTLPARWLYDEAGSRLFDRITRLPEYYPTRSEARILRDRAGEIVDGSRTVVDLGAGTAEKTRVLLDALVAGGGGAPYVPVDISTEMLHETANTLAGEYPDLRVRPVVADITDLEPPRPGCPRPRPA